ncbi:DUF4381 domain-containing protein [Vibrio sp. T187]|uniref:DUF4381 domain-containing protein n=1 Tax=Vibrio TaxID=662 RepID=UPI0010C98B3A|nr:MULTISPECIES: DUF4381 domain-containing protein [Vibrio]MBW3695468.1 DUF4381 domain-containing protein [Vibrio sp. T187]
MTNNTQTPPLELSPSILPAAPSWWPLQWGWWSLAAVAIVTIIAILFVIKYRKKKLASKKAALKLFTLETQPLTPSSALEVLRQAALSYYPRERVAQLTGDDWYQFLDSQVAQPIFTHNQQTWQQALYSNENHEQSSQLVKDCERWIAEALPPKRGGRE